MNKLKIYDRRTELHKEIKHLVYFMAGICACGIGFRIEAKLAEPTWAEQQLVLAVEPIEEKKGDEILTPFVGSCQGFGCVIDENDKEGLKPTQKFTSVPQKKEYQLSDKALDCVAKRPEVAKKIGDKFGEYGQYAIELFAKESCLNPKAINPTSGACSLAQAYPCSKLPCSLDDVDCQIDWAFKYVQNRYGNAENSLEFHLANNWY